MFLKANSTFYKSIISRTAALDTATYAEYRLSSLKKYVKVNAT